MTADRSRRNNRPVSLGTSALRGAAALQDLLGELALVLLPRGMTPKRFAELASVAFVQAAADMSRLQNGRVNHSRVAAQTGLSRADVKRLLAFNVLDTARSGLTAIEKVVHGWRTDRRFRTRIGHPKRLPISGSEISFASLVREYGGDVTHRAVLDELRRIGAIRDASGQIQLRPSPFLHCRFDFAFLSPVLPALVDGLRIASDTSATSVTAPVRRLTIPAETDVDLAIVRDRCASSAQSMLDGLAHSLGKQVTVPHKRRAPAHSFTVTILLSEGYAKRRKNVRAVMTSSLKETQND